MTELQHEELLNKLFPYNFKETELLTCIEKIFDKNTGFLVKDRKYRLKTYKQCVLGSECVSWIIKNTNFDESKETFRKRQTAKFFGKSKKKKKNFFYFLIVLSSVN